MYGLDEPKRLEALLGETTANKAELVDSLVLLDCLRAMAIWGGGVGGSLLKWYSKRWRTFYIFIFVPCDRVREQYISYLSDIVIRLNHQILT